MGQIILALGCNYLRLHYQESFVVTKEAQVAIKSTEQISVFEMIFLLVFQASLL